MIVTEHQLQSLRQSRLHICIPCPGGHIDEACFVSMLTFAIDARGLGMDFAVQTLASEPLTPRARNSLVAMMLAAQPKSTHLMFIDPDVGFEADAIFKLILADKEVVGGLCPQRAAPLSYVVSPTPGAKRTADLLPVDTLGAQFMLIRRTALERLLIIHQDLKIEDWNTSSPGQGQFKYALFDTMIHPETRDYLSEDQVFCLRWRAAGGEIFVDLSISLSTTGTTTFRGDAAKLLEGFPA